MFNSTAKIFEFTKNKVATSNLKNLFFINCSFPYFGENYKKV